jgi:hypothetical protein
VLLATTPNVYNFFSELEKPFEPERPAGPPTPEDVRHLLAAAAKYNYWIASPQENAAIGLTGFGRLVAGKGGEHDDSSPSRFTVIVRN